MESEWRGIRWESMGQHVMISGDQHTAAVTHERAQSARLGTCGHSVNDEWQGG